MRAHVHAHVSACVLAHASQERTKKGTDNNRNGTREVPHPAYKPPTISNSLQHEEWANKADKVFENAFN